ncbi:unnamed protein product [Camellia sinensis]
MSSENTIKTLSQSLRKFVDFSNGEIQSRSNRDLHEHHRPVRVSRLAKTRATIDFTANSSISVWSATTNPEAGQTVGGRVELVIYVVTLSCNIYFKFKILCKPHDRASLAPSVPVHCKSAPSQPLTGPSRWNHNFWSFSCHR